MKAMILAAGRGLRMQPLTDTIPKPLVKIGNHALIEYHLLALANSGIKEIIINVAHLGQQIVAALGDGQRYGVSITYSHEPENASLETGGGIFQALPFLGAQPFIVVSADLWTDYPFQNLPQTLDGLAHLVLVDNPEHHQHGDFVLKNKKIFAEGENKLNYAGIGVFHPQLFRNCKAGKFPLAPLILKAIKQGLVTGEHYQGIWHNIGTLEQLKTLSNR